MISECVCEGVSWRVKLLIQETRRKDPSSLIWSGVTQFVRGVSRPERWRRGALAPSSWAGLSIFSCLWTTAMLVLGLWDSSTFAVSSPGSLHTQIELYSSGLDSLAWRQQIMGLLGLCNHASQFLSRFFSYMHTLYWFCFSENRWLITVY